MEDFENMTAQELVVFAQERGLSRKILGLTLIELKATLKYTMGSIAEQRDESLESLSWAEIRKLAKDKGISIYKKKRKELEALLCPEMTLE